MKQSEALALVGAAALAIWALSKKGEGIGGITTILPSATPGGTAFAMPSFPELAFTMPEFSFTMPEFSFTMPEFNLPNWPDLPGIPDMPDLPDLPGIPNLPDLPGMPDLPGLPDLTPDWTAYGAGEWAAKSLVGGAVNLIRGGLAGAYEAVEPEREAWKAAAKGFTQEPVKTALIPGYGLYQAFQGMKESMSEGYSKETYLAGTATRETGVEEAAQIQLEIAQGLRDAGGMLIVPTAANRPGLTYSGEGGETYVMTQEEDEAEKRRLLALSGRVQV